MDWVVTGERVLLEIRIRLPGFALLTRLPVCHVSQAIRIRVSRARSGSIVTGLLSEHFLDFLKE